MLLLGFISSVEIDIVSARSSSKQTIWVFWILWGWKGTKYKCAMEGSRATSMPKAQLFL